MRDPMRDEQAGLPGIDALDRILAASGDPRRRLVPARFEHAGVALILLIVQPEATLGGPLTRRRWTQVDGVICMIAEAFAEALGPPARSLFWRGSALAGLRRLLGRNLKITRDGDGFASELRISDPEWAFEQVAAFLRHRNVDGAQAAAAFDALVSAYRQREPRLAAFGQSGEYPASTARLRRRLLDQLDSHAGRKEA
jgi:hypothetical protein